MLNGEWSDHFGDTVLLRPLEFRCIVDLLAHARVCQNKSTSNLPNKVPDPVLEWGPLHPPPFRESTPFLLYQSPSLPSRIWLKYVECCQKRPEGLDVLHRPAATKEILWRWLHLVWQGLIHLALWCFFPTSLKGWGTRLPYRDLPGRYLRYLPFWFVAGLLSHTQSTPHSIDAAFRSLPPQIESEELLQRSFCWAVAILLGYRHGW